MSQLAPFLRPPERALYQAPMTTPVGPQSNERRYRFKDEWLVSLVATLPGVTQELIKRWRFQQKSYIA